MINTETKLNQSIGCMEINDTLINLIVDKMVEEMTYKIEHISPDYDPSAEYGEYWTTGTCEDEDNICIAEPYDEYSISYGYELSWQYCKWTEFWTDPVCYPEFSDMRNETGNVFDVEVYTPNGNKADQEICDLIAKRVNDRIK